MLIAACWLIAATLAAQTSSLAAAPVAKPPVTPSHEADSWSPEGVDQAWAAKVLADPEYDRGWLQPCHDDWGDDRESTCEVRELAYRPGDRPIAIDGGANGGMTVMGWDRSDSRVIYRVKARARTKEQANALAKQIRLVFTQGKVRPEGPEKREGQWWSVEVKAWVPRSSDLSLHSHNGPIGVHQVRGTMDIRSVNGPVALIDLGGAVMARAQNGPLHVELTGSKWSGTGLDAEAQNGPLHLEVPKGYSARLQTGTLNGPSDIDYPLDFQGRIRGHFTTTLGSGGTMIRVVTDNGPFQLAER